MKIEIVKWLVSRMSEEQLNEIVTWLVLETVKRIPQERRAAIVAATLRALETVEGVLEQAG